jgi:hypothetical protein
MRKSLFNRLAGLLLLPGFGMGQVLWQSGSLTVGGYSGQVPIIQIGGKSYVEVEALSRLVRQADPPARAFSTDFLKAGVEALSAIREWRITIIHAIQNSLPLNESWVGGYRRTAETKLALASAAISTEADRNGFPLLENQVANMRKLSDSYVALRKDSLEISQDTLDNNPLDQQILSCGRGLAALAAKGQFEDVLSCH